MSWNQGNFVVLLIAVQIFVTKLEIFTSVRRHFLLSSTDVCQLVTHETKSFIVNRNIQYCELSVVIVRILKLPLYYERVVYLFLVWTPSSAVCCGGYKILYPVSRTRPPSGLHPNDAYSVSTSHCSRFV